MSEVEPPEVGFTETSGATDTLASWQDYDEQAHTVQFYETDEFLIGEASRFIGAALGSGNAGVVIATEPHRGAIADRLASFGLDPRAAVAQGRYVALDAAETLATFVVGDGADPERFARGIGDVIDRARQAVGRSDARVAAFGEMVALLWAEGKRDAAIRLEQLWNALAGTHACSLRCAYPVHGFSKGDAGEPFLQICGEHSHVLPAESYTARMADEDRRRALAQLQQKAYACEGQGQAALRQTEERFRLLVEGVQDYAIYSLDLNGTITSWNAGARRIKGYTAEEIIGQNFSRFYTREDAERSLPAVVLQTARNEGHYEGEGWRVRKDGSRFWSNVVVTPLKDEAGNIIGFSKITRDMTERKALLDRIQEHAQELEKAQQTLRRLSGQLLQVQDDERRRLAHELHDGTGQILAALNMNLESLHEAVKGQIAPTLAQRLAESIRLANQVIKETRTLAYLLHPPLLDEAGLRDALHWFVGGFIERSGIPTDLEISPNLSRLPQELEIAVFRIVQEALTNIHRHSGSSKASIQLAVNSNEISLTIADQGVGIPATVMADEQHKGNKLGVGIAAMRERVLRLGGQFEIVPGNPGAIVKAVIPLPRLN